MPLQKRGQTYYLRRRVPRKYLEVELRKEIKLSLGTDSLAVARSREASVWNQQIAQWEALIRGDVDAAEDHFRLAQDIARAYRVKFMPAVDVAQLPPREFVERIEKAMNADGRIDDRKALGVLGTVPKPKLTLSKALVDFWSLSRPDVAGKSPTQLRLWQNPRKRAFSNFYKAVGDIALEDLTSDHMLEFREWLWMRIEGGEIKEGTANKDITHLGSVLKKVNKMRRLGLDLPLTGWMFSERPVGTRDPFSVQWIKTHFIDGEKLSGMNDQARAIMQGMINTGARLGEIANLMPEDISLEGKVPFIHIRPKANREIKNANSIRIIPLAGVSLDAIRGNLVGFPRYRDKAGVSATINKYLRSNGLLETPKHTLYGLRHSFEDRMLEAGIDERVRRDLLGHGLDRERYGEGGRLEFRHAQVLRVAL